MGSKFSLLTAIRAMLELYNIKRKIIGFDTFEGLLVQEKKMVKNFMKKED